MPPAAAKRLWEPIGPPTGQPAAGSTSHRWATRRRPPQPTYREVGCDPSAFLERSTAAAAGATRRPASPPANRLLLVPTLNTSPEPNVRAKEEGTDFHSRSAGRPASQQAAPAASAAGQPGGPPPKRGPSHTTRKWLAPQPLPPARRRRPRGSSSRRRKRRLQQQQRGRLQLSPSKQSRPS